MNPQNNPYSGQPYASPTPVGQFGANAGQNYMGVPAQGQPMLPNPTMPAGGMSPVPVQALPGVPTGQYGTGAGPHQQQPNQAGQQLGQFMPPAPQQPQAVLAPQLPITHQAGSAQQSVGVANEMPQQAVLRLKQAVVQHANNPFEMAQAVQTIRSEYLQTQFNINSKSADS